MSRKEKKHGNSNVLYYLRETLSGVNVAKRQVLQVLHLMKLKLQRE